MKLAFVTLSTQSDNDKNSERIRKLLHFKPKRCASKAPISRNECHITYCSSWKISPFQL